MEKVANQQKEIEDLKTTASFLSDKCKTITASADSMAPILPGGKKAGRPPKPKPQKQHHLAWHTGRIRGKPEMQGILSRFLLESRQASDQAFERQTTYRH